MREIELPEICQEDQHSWSEMSAHACGAWDGDQVMDEGIVFGVPVKQNIIGSICRKCFQIYGKPQGTRDPNITIVYQHSREWDLKQPQ